ncbi:hypothetical protein QSV37_17590 [Acinetobacter sp. VNK23]|uniref:hypothetical protein n=1 Tax=Acinetobacter thutiue TaxID=2998078 RepID=UPI002574F71C|nr:hypothetical protein [Acinetobacter thutiue]MDM1022088.1 hypothetical protein [Acinetobacter thutiue]
MNDPYQLFHLFYQDVTPDMNPPGMKHRGDAMYHFWRERFINAFLGIEEPCSMRSWGEVPQMWLKGIKRGQNINNFN